MIDIAPHEVGKVVPEFTYEYQSMLLCIKWAFEHGFTDGDIQSYDDFSEWLDGLPEDDWSWFVDMDIPHYIEGIVMDYLNENLPLGFRAIWTLDDGLSIENEE